MKLLYAMTIAAFALGGCHYYQDYRIKKTTADVNEQRAANMRAYRDCMRRYERHPDANQICAPYYNAAYH